MRDGEKYSVQSVWDSRVSCLCGCFAEDGGALSRYYLFEFDTGLATLPDGRGMLWLWHRLIKRLSEGTFYVRRVTNIFRLFPDFLSSWQVFRMPHRTDLRSPRLMRCCRQRYARR